MEILVHQLFRVGLGAAAIALIWLGVDSIRQTREMQRNGKAWNLLGMTPWYSYFMTDDRMRDLTIINHNFIVAGFAILAGIGAAMLLAVDLIGTNSVL
jgi:hypothetical protein